MMLPDGQWKKFRAIEEDAGQADSCLLTRPPDRVTVRRAALAATASACGSAPNPTGGRAMRGAFSQILTDTPEMFTKSWGWVPLFPMTNLRMAPGVM